MSNCVNMSNSNVSTINIINTISLRSQQELTACCSSGMRWEDCTGLLLHHPPCALNESLQRQCTAPQTHWMECAHNQDVQALCEHKRNPLTEIQELLHWQRRRWELGEVIDVFGHVGQSCSLHQRPNELHFTRHPQKLKRKNRNKTKHEHKTEWIALALIMRELKPAVYSLQPRTWHCYLRDNLSQWESAVGRQPANWIPGIPPT